MLSIDGAIISMRQSAAKPRPRAWIAGRHAQQRTTQEFGGTYSVQGNLLVLERKDGSPTVGQLTLEGQKKFNCSRSSAKEKSSRLEE
jgi:hypothetical protein